MLYAFIFNHDVPYAIRIRVLDDEHCETKMKIFIMKIVILKNV